MIIYEDGTILNDAYDGRVIHERNGRFDIEFKLPTNNDKYKLLKKFGVIETKVPYLNEQKFDITSIKKKLGYIEVFANHVGFRLDKNVTKDITSSNVLANTILQRFKASLQKETEFNFMSDITDSRQFNTVGFENALDTLTKGKHSILGQWGGVLVFDNFNIELRKRFGRDTEYLIAKRKNINDLEIDEKSDGVITRLIISKEIEVDEDKELIYATVDSPLIEEYPEVYLRHIETTDETVETVEDLIAYGEDVFRLQKIDLPTESFTIDTTESINNFNFTIDDTAIIHYEDYGIDKRVMVTSYEYDPIAKRYIKVHFGDKEKSLMQSTTDIVTDKIETEIINPNMTYIDRVFDEIRDNLKDPTGGVIKLTKDNEGNIIEILILDNEDLDQAMEVWRWNIQGLSHSSNGINGDFNIAITQDGQMVADFMTTGVLNASLLKTGFLAAQNNEDVWIDMESGNFNLGGMSYDGSTFKIQVGNQDLEDKLQDLEDGIGQNKTKYMWRKYADDENGGGMSDSNIGKNYIGLAFNKDTEEASDNPLDYEWTLLTGHDGVSPVYGTLTSNAHVFAADEEGTVTNYAGASTELEIYYGQRLDTSNWNISTTASSGITGTLVGNKYTITGMNKDMNTGTVYLTAERTGFPTIQKEFKLSKNKKGWDSKNYSLVTDTKVIKKNKLGILNPKTITMNAFVHSGEEDDIEDYEGKFRIETSTNGSNYTKRYATGAWEHEKTYTLPSDVYSVRIYLISASSDPHVDPPYGVLDKETIMVINDGTDGEDGSVGEDGTDGVGVTSVRFQYYTSTNPNYIAGGSWSYRAVWEKGKYMFERQETTLDNGQVIYSPVNGVRNESLDKLNEINFGIFDPNTEELVSLINLTPKEAKIKSDNIELEGITTINDNFVIDTDGKMSARGAKISSDGIDDGNYTLVNIEDGIINIEDEDHEYVTRIRNNYMSISRRYLSQGSQSSQWVENRISLSPWGMVTQEGAPDSEFRHKFYIVGGEERPNVTGRPLLISSEYGIDLQTDKGVLRINDKVAGYIVERGNNTNGEWIKFSDGTMICWMKTSATIDFQTEYGASYIGAYRWTYPQKYHIEPNVIVNRFRWGTGLSWGAPISVSADGTYAELRGYDFYPRPAGQTSVEAIAIGRWM